MRVPGTVMHHIGMLGGLLDADPTNQRIRRMLEERKPRLRSDCVVVPGLAVRND